MYFNYDEVLSVAQKLRAQESRPEQVFDLVLKAVVPHLRFIGEQLYKEYSKSGPPSRQEKEKAGLWEEAAWDIIFTIERGDDVGILMGELALATNKVLRATAHTLNAMTSSGDGIRRGQAICHAQMWQLMEACVEALDILNQKRHRRLAEDGDTFSYTTSIGEETLERCTVL